MLARIHHRVWLGLITLGAIVLFLARLDRYPPGLYIDEALVGYSAYSLGETGKDEWGMNWPVFLRFYGSYNPPLYTYLSIIPIKIFGNTVEAVRLVSAVAGIAAVLSIYHLARRLAFKISASLVSAIILLTSPWVMLYARTGYEVHLAAVWLIWGLYWLYRSLTKIDALSPAVIFLSLAAYTAYAERLLAPILLLGFLILFHRKLGRLEHRPALVRALGLGLVINLPHLWLLTTPAFLPKDNELYQGLGLLESWREFLAQYSNYLSPASLFFRPDPDLQRSLPGLAVFYPWLIAPYFLGLSHLWQQRNQPWAKFIGLVLLCSPIPAALTRDPFASHRAYPLMVPLVLVLTLGLDSIRAKIDKRIFWLGFLGLISVSLFFLAYAYFRLLPARSKLWMAGFDQLATQIRDNPETHYILDQGRLKPGYANLGFFLPYPPEKFQQQYGRTTMTEYYFDISFNPEFDFGQVELRPLDWQKDSYRHQVIIGDQLSVSPTQAEEHFLTQEFEIYDNWGQRLFIGWRTHPIQKCQHTLVLPQECEVILKML